MFSAVQMIILGLFVELIDHHGLLPWFNDAMACEDVENKEVSMRLIDKSLSQVCACFLEVAPTRISEVVHASSRLRVHRPAVDDSILLHCLSKGANVLWCLWDIMGRLDNLPVFVYLPDPVQDTCWEVECNGLISCESGKFLLLLNRKGACHDTFDQ